MAAGLQAWTSTGLLQIDGESVNMTLRTKATLTTVQGTYNVAASNAGAKYGFTAYCLYWNFTAVQPCVAFTATNGIGVALISVVPQGNNVWQALFWSADAAVFTAYVFDRADGITSSGHVGLQVYNSTGGLIADAALPMMRPIAVVSGNVGNMSAGWGQITWPAAFSTNYNQAGPSMVATGAMSCASAAFLGQSSSDSTGWLGISAWIHATGGAVQFQWQMKQYKGGTAPANYVGYGSALSWSALLIDVSNL